MKSKESGTVRYAYGVATALLLGGTAFSLATGSAGAQVAQNAPLAAPPGGAPMSFADLSARLQPAVVNISTRQRVPVRTQADPLEEFFGGEHEQRGIGGVSNHGVYTQRAEQVGTLRDRRERRRQRTLGIQHSLGWRIEREHDSWPTDTFGQVD